MNDTIDKLRMIHTAARGLGDKMLTKQIVIAAGRFVLGDTSEAAQALRAVRIHASVNVKQNPLYQQVDGWAGELLETLEASM